MARKQCGGGRLYGGCSVCIGDERKEKGLTCGPGVPASQGVGPSCRRERGRKGSGAAIGYGRWLGWAGLMAFGPEKEGEGRSRPAAGCGEAKGEERELGLRARNERGGFYFFPNRFLFLF